MIPKLKQILVQNNVPEAVIKELEEKSSEYQQNFLYAIEKIMQNEVISLHSFMEMREKYKTEIQLSAKELN